MSSLLPTLQLDSEPVLSEHFTPYQVHWILAEDAFHAQGKQVYALAEKSIRIGWTFCDGFKNVRKRLRFKKRDYLFATKDLPSALEYMKQVYAFAELFDLTGSILSHGEEFLNVPRLDHQGRPTCFTDEIKVGVIKFDNGSRIIAFSSHPQAMAVYGGDVGLDEFAKHPNAKLLWEIAQGRVTWNGDLAVWSSHDGEDTLFYQFAQQARAGEGPWNLYYRITMPDALDLGLLELINRTTGSRFTRRPVPRRLSGPRRRRGNLPASLYVQSAPALRRHRRLVRHRTLPLRLPHRAPPPRTRANPLPLRSPPPRLRILPPIPNQEISRFLLPRALPRDSPRPSERFPPLLLRRR